MLVLCGCCYPVRDQADFAVHALADKPTDLQPLVELPPTPAEDEKADKKTSEAPPRKARGRGFTASRTASRGATPGR